MNEEPISLRELTLLTSVETVVTMWKFVEMSKGVIGGKQLIDAIKSLGSTFDDLYQKHLVEAANARAADILRQRESFTLGMSSEQLEKLASVVDKRRRDELAATAPDSTGSEHN